jgi:hypothetical protein
MKNRKAIYVIRAIHTFIAAFFVFCIGFLYYFVFTEKQSPWIVWIIAILIAEGVVLIANQWRCPLSLLHQKYGDDKKFYDLFFPEKIAPYAGHILGAATIIAIILLLAKHII